MNEDFTNREIQAMFQNIDDKLEEHGKTHEKILDAVTKTNGKVADIQAWRERMNGASLVAFAFFSAIIIPIVTWMVYSILHLPDLIRDELSAYEITIQ